MKKLIFVLGLTGALLTPGTQASIDQITLSDTLSPTHSGYVANVTSGLGSVVGGGGQLGVANNNSFITFCLETTEYFNPGWTYNVTLNSGAVNGGAGGGNPDPISMATAYLYSQFRNGVLSETYTDNNGVKTVAYDRASLQQAIWFLEQEQVNAGTGAGLVKLAESKLGLNDSNVKTTDANGAYGVVVMNVYYQNGTLSQDQLAIAVPEPSTVIAGALLLLPFGASVLRTVRKNRAA